MQRLTKSSVVEQPTERERAQLLELAEHILGGTLSYFLDTGQFAASVMQGGGGGPGRPWYEFDSRRVGQARADGTWAVMRWPEIRRALRARLRADGEQLSIFDALGAAA